MNLTSLKGATSPFAHLFGRAPKAAAKANSENEENCDDKEKEEKEAKAKAEAEEKEKEEKEAKAKADADEQEKNDKDEKAKKAKAKTDAEDGDDDEMKGAKAERARWVTVLQGSAAVGRVEAALNMLAMTEMSAPEISGVLATLPVAAKSGDLGTRMGGTQIPNPGDGGRASGLSPTDPKAIASAVLAAGKKARGEA